MKTVEQLETEIKELKAELAYHEAYQMSGDGVRCEYCGRVRHVDDCIAIQSGVGTLYVCCEDCERRTDR